MTHRTPRLGWWLAVLLISLSIGVSGCQGDRSPEPAGGTATIEPQPAAAPESVSADQPAEPAAESAAAPVTSEAASPAIDTPPPSADEPPPGPAFPSDAPASAMTEETTDGDEFPAVGTQPGEQQMPDLDAANRFPEVGPPLVENADDLVRLDPARPLWIDRAQRRVVMVGLVCARQVPLEMLVCPWQTKEHESVLVVNVRAADVHAALLATGAEAGHPVQYDPYQAAAGTVIDIGLAWKDEQGQIQHARGQDWVRNMKTGKPLDHNWVFAGSGFWVDESTGEKRYMAEGGDFICVSNFATAMLDLPIESSQSQNDLLYEAFTERIPPLRTPVTIVLDPVLPSEQPAEQ